MALPKVTKSTRSSKATAESRDESHDLAAKVAKAYERLPAPKRAEFDQLLANMIALSTEVVEEKAPTDPKSRELVARQMNQMFHVTALSEAGKALCDTETVDNDSFWRMFDTIEKKVLHIHDMLEAAQRVQA